MAGQSVHFWGKANVLAAYNSLEIPAWSLWQGSQMLPFKYDGDDLNEGAEKLLSTFNAMTESTNALYTLKVYETLKDGKISKSTPDSGAFNFRLNLELQGLNQQQLQSVTTRTQLESEIAALKSELAALRDELDEEPEPDNQPDMWERINGLLEKPAVVGAINRIFKLDLQPRAGSISGVPVGEEKLSEAIEILKQHDPRLTEHLWKLAVMAQEKPNNFNFLLSTLDTLQ